MTINFSVAYSKINSYKSLIKKHIQLLTLDSVSHYSAQLSVFIVLKDFCTFSRV